MLHNRVNKETLQEYIPVLAVGIESVHCHDSE